MTNPLRKLVVGLALVLTLVVGGASMASACSFLYASSVSCRDVSETDQAAGEACEDMGFN